MGILTGKVALVTGTTAPNGIGRAISKRLAKDGATVIVSDTGGILTTEAGDLHRADLLKGLVQDIEENGGTARAVELDVTSADDIARAMEDAQESLGRLDILINNAGTISGVGPFLNTTPDQWQTSFAVNMLGPVMLAQAAIPLMRTQDGGRIINIGSTGSLGAHAGFGAYTTMKHGMVGLTKTIAAEFGPDGILCNLVCPGFIATDMHEAANTRIAAETGTSIEETRLRRYADVSLRRAGQPEEVANMVAFLAGPEGSYITGTTLAVAGGVPLGL
ncbi:MAG: SDR family NAD(P)-dependent oxidoreductase [Pseudomonadota bacterium]